MQAVIFDVDGVLIDSEPLWEEAVREVLSRVGVSLTRQEYDQTRGSRIDRFIAHWHRVYPWVSPSVEEVAEEIVRRVIRLIHARGIAKPGALEAVRFVKAKQVPLGLASSSAAAIIDAVVKCLGLEHTFDAICSAEHEPLGKPHPGVYLTAASRLGVQPQDCLVIEDSINGVLAAKAAQMTCICVPDALTVRDTRLGIADAVLTSLTYFDEALWAQITTSNGSGLRLQLQPRGDDDLPGQIGSFLEEIRSALNGVDTTCAEQLQQTIIQAPRIFLAGKGRTGFHMQSFAMRLAQMGLSAYVVGETVTPRIEAGDLLLIGSASGQTPSLVSYADRAREVGADVAVLTGLRSALLVQKARHAVCIPAPSKLDQQNGAASVQPMGTLFEAALGLFLDTLVLRMMRDLDVSADQMAARHANLE